jgi:hypothetical protein
MISRFASLSAVASFIVIYQLLTVAGQAQTNGGLPTSGVSFSETSGNGWTVGNVTRGYTIDVTQPFAISALGVFDSGGEPLFDNHIVSVWNAGGTLIASVTVPAGTGGELVNQFSYAPITPLILNDGNYTIGAYYPVSSQGFDNLGDPEIFGISDVSVNPDFSIVGYEFAHPGYADPAHDLTDQENFGANFLITQVPEPSALALFGLGAAGLIAGRRCHGLVRRTSQPVSSETKPVISEVVRTI